MMNKILIIVLLFFICNSCIEKANENKELNPVRIEYRQIVDVAYILEKPIKKPSAVLFLFGGYPEDAEDIKREFNILGEAKKHEMAVIYSNFNQKLWLEKEELESLAEQIKKVFTDNNLPTNNVYFGGFSSGGNVAFLLGDYFTKNYKLKLQPKGLFLVDSPIDLSALYYSSQKNIKRNFSETAIQESKWIIKTLDDRFGNPENNLDNYENYSVYISKTQNINNIENLKNTKIRLYTEPDTVWWNKNRMADFDQMNAFYIKNLSKILKQKGFLDVEYIPTENKGYRADGERHPHSWSIVDINQLLEWILSNKREVKDD